MKVILISNSSWNLFNFRIDLIKDLIKKNVKVYTLAPLDQETYNLKKLGCIHVDIPLKKRTLNPFFELITFFSLLKIIYKIKPDYLLSFTIKPNIYSSIISRLFKIKNIVNITGLGSALLKKNFLFYMIIFFYKLSISLSDMIFFQNKEDLHFFKKYNLIRAANYKVIPGSGVNLKYFNINNFDEVKKDIDFLYVGRLIKDKGINEFCEASKSIIINKLKLNILIVTHDGLNLEYYKNKYPELNFESNVADIRNFYIRSKCTVLPSYREGTPKSLLESCAMYVPIIATNVVGCREILIENFNGLFCIPYSHKDLEKIMLKYLDISASKKVTLSFNARKVVEDKFDANFVIRAYCDFLNIKS